MGDIPTNGGRKSNISCGRCEDRQNDWQHEAPHHRDFHPWADLGRCQTRVADGRRPHMPCGFCVDSDPVLQSA